MSNLTQLDSHSSSNHPPLFPLSKIHRLLRPLKTSLLSLNHAILHSSNQFRLHSINQKKHSRYFPLHSSQKRRPAAAQDLDFFPFPKRIYKPSKRFSLPIRNHTNKLSSPIFSSPSLSSKKSLFKLSSKLSSRPPSSSSSSLFRIPFPQDDDPASIDLLTKLDKLLLAYRNILDAISPLDDPRLRRLSDRSFPPSSIIVPSPNIDRLSTICARLIGRSIELALNQAVPQHPSPHDHQLDEPDSLWLTNDPDSKTSVMDEWYDAIPLLYRRHTLPQHALSLILLSFPASASPSELAYHLKLFHALHLLHRSYLSPLVQPQALLLLPSLFALPPDAWFELYDDYCHKFGLQDPFVARFLQSVKGRPFEYWSNWHTGLASFVDLAIDRFGALAFEAWVAEREQLVARRARWRRSLLARSAGLLSSDSDSDQEDIVSEFDKRTAPTLVRWLDALTAACLPTALTCLAARGVLNAISRALFDCLASAATECSASDNYLLSVLAITVEAHRLALFGLAMFNSGPLDQPGSTPDWASPHTPLRLQALVPGRESPLSQKVLSKAAKLFFRAHRHTRLLAMLPGPVVGAPIPGLDGLLRMVVEGECALETVAKSWVESLLLTDPASWWTRPDDGSEDEETRARGAQDVRSWLEDWLGVLDDAERLRAADSDSEERAEEQDDSLTLPGPVSLASPMGTAEDTKPEGVCTCVSHDETEVEPEVLGEVEDKPEVEENASWRVGLESQGSNVRVVVPGPQRFGQRKSIRGVNGNEKSQKQMRIYTPPCTRAQVRKGYMGRESGEGVSLGRGSLVGRSSSGMVMGISGAEEVEEEEEDEDKDEVEEEEDNDDEDDEFDAMDLLRKPTPCSVGGGGGRCSSSGSRFVTPVSRIGGGSGFVSGSGGGSGRRSNGGFVCRSGGVGGSNSGGGVASGSGGASGIGTTTSTSLSCSRSENLKEGKRRNGRWKKVERGRGGRGEKK